MNTDRIKQLEKFLEEDSNDSFTIYALALEYINIKNDARAKELFLKLNNSFPDYLPAYYHFGKLYERLNEKEKANALYIIGVELAEKKKELKTLNELKEAYNSLNGIEED